MKKIYFVTTNSKKLEDARSVFGDDFEIEGVGIDLLEIQTLDQKKLSKSKAEQAFNALHQPVMVDDSGIFIKKYNNFPGILTKYFLEGVGLENVLKLIEEGDEAEFRTVITYMDGEREIVVEGAVEGTLTKTISGEVNPKAPFSSIFRVGNKLMKDLAGDELKIYSHRGRALEQLKKEFEKCDL